MKTKNIKWIVSILAFCLCFLLLFGAAGNLLRLKAQQPADVVGSFYKEPKNSVDVLIMGSSHAYFGMYPMEMWKQQGITAYTLGSAQQPLSCSYYLLKEGIRTQHPKVVILETYYTWLNKKYSDEARIQVPFAAVPLNKNKIEMVNDLFGDKSFKERANYYLPFLQFHSRWGELEKSDITPEGSYLKGAKVRFGGEAVKEPVRPEEYGEIPEASLEYLRKIAELCRQEGAALILTQMPFGDDKSLGTYDLQQKIMNSVEDFADQNEIPCFNYQKMGVKIGIDFSTDFYNTTHLNASGADKVTAHLANFIKKNYGLEDHRGDKRYSAWEEDCRQYEQYRVEMEEYAKKKENKGQNEEDLY